MIDVGGAALLGAAARNAAGVAAVASPDHYPRLVAELARARPRLARSSARRLAAEAFGTVAAYYAEIAAYLNQISGNMFPERLALVLEKVADLRYGENPHQHGGVLPGDDAPQRNARRRDPAPRRAAVVQQPASTSTRHTGSRPTTPRRRSRSSSTPTPSGSRPPTSWSRPTGAPSRPTRSRRSAGSSGSTASSTGATAREIAANSYEAVVAPGYSQAALGILKAKAGLEILAVPPDPTEGMRDYGIANLDFKRVAGGLLVESLDELGLDRGRLQVVTQRRPTLDELNDLLFAWRAVRHVRSNAIVLARNGATVGIGAAQASRQVSVEIALRRAGDRAKTAVMASDAYFPFPDGIQMAAQAGRHRDRPAGRLDPRRDGDRGRRSPPHGDGVHRASRHFRH